MPDQPTKNMIGVLQAVAQYAREKHWTPPQARKVARMCIACVMTESNGHMYANTGVPNSMKLPHDAMGQDHDSVGLFQQRVTNTGNGHGWGTVAQAMDIRHSTRAFIGRAEDKGLTRLNLPPGTRAYNGHVIGDVFDRIQDVQVSWYDGSVSSRPFGGNYRSNRARSWAFLLRYWSTKTMTAKSKVNYL